MAYARRHHSTMKNPSILEELIEALRCLPGVGPSPRSAWRSICCSMIATGAARLRIALGRALELIAIANAATRSPRSRCAAVPLAAARARLLCVVETPADMLMMEQAQCYRGCTSC